MPIELNADSFEIKNYEMTPQGYLKFWLVGGIPDKELVYDGGKRKEIINADNLFDEVSINSAVGKPVRLNHPPRPINSRNYKDNMHGVVLQEYSKDADTGALVLAGIVHDADVVDGIMKNKYKYISAGYSATKTPNDDGVLVQSNREYDHFAVLSEEFAPRAGEESKVLILVDTVEKQQDATSTTTTSTNNNTVDMEKLNQDIAGRVELLTTWKPILEEHKKAIDYNADSKAIKRQILSIYYPEKTMKFITNENIDGVWVGFITTANLNSDAGDDVSDNQSHLPTSAYRMKTPVSKSSVVPANYDATLDSEIEKFIKKMEGRTV